MGPKTIEALKPRLRPVSIPWMEAIVRYASEHDCFEPEVISDALDGYAFRDEIADIIKAGIAVEIELGQGEYTLAGVTWHLTDYGVNVVRRAAIATASTTLEAGAAK